MDWRLPTKYELNEMYNLKNQIGGFKVTQYSIYWSSVAYGSNNWYFSQDFYDGAVYEEGASNSRWIRCVREF